MYVFPVTVIEKVARENRSAFPDAPVVPWEPPQRRRWLTGLSSAARWMTALARRTTTAAAAARQAPITSAATVGSAASADRRETAASAADHRAVVAREGANLGVCEAEARDRSPKAASAASAC